MQSAGVLHDIARLAQRTLGSTVQTASWSEERIEKVHKGTDQALTAVFKENRDLITAKATPKLDKRTFVLLDKLMSKSDGTLTLDSVREIGS